MAHSNTLPLSRTYSRAGVKGGTLPQIEPDIQPVMIVANYADLQTGSQYEQRAIVTAFQNNSFLGGNDHMAIVLDCFSPGGLIVEKLDGKNASNPTRPIFVWVEPIGGLTGSIFNHEPVNFGGLQVKSKCRSGGIASTLGAHIEFTESVFVFQVNWYVAPGDSIIIALHEAGASGLNAGYQWRELPETLGAP